MLWVALGTLLMILTGSGDDTKAMRARADLLRKSVQKVAADQARATRAVQSVDDFERAFGAHRERLKEIGSCVERMDRQYAVSQADYMGCVAELDAGWELTINHAIDAQQLLRQSLTDEEWQELRAEIGDE